MQNIIRSVVRVRHIHPGENDVYTTAAIVGYQLQEVEIKGPVNEAT